LISTASAARSGPASLLVGPGIVKEQGAYVNDEDVTAAG
jgi:hypothetical protein